MSRHLYLVTFNDFGSDYVLADSWDKAGEIVASFYNEVHIKKIEYVGEEASTIDVIGTKLHIQETV